MLTVEKLQRAIDTLKRNEQEGFEIERADAAAGVLNASGPFRLKKIGDGVYRSDGGEFGLGSIFVFPKWLEQEAIAEGLL